MHVDNSAAYLAAYRTSAAYQTQNVSISGSYLEITGGSLNSGQAVGEDGVDISETARELLDRIRDLDVFSIIYPNKDPRQNVKSLSQVQDDFMADFYDFSAAFGAMAGAMGASGSDSFVMGLDGVGGMTVEGSSEAMAAKLQSGFNGNSTMVSRFAVMAARAALVDAGNTVPGFKDAYASDAPGAISDNIAALKERLLGFRTVAGDGTMQYGFMRDFELQYGSTSAAYSAAADAVDAES